MDADSLVISTLLGTIKCFQLVRGNGNGLPQIQQVWEKECENVEKVNALVVFGTRIVIGGFGKDGKGIIAIWDQQCNEP